MKFYMVMLACCGLQLAAGEPRDIREEMKGVERFGRELQELWAGGEVRASWPREGTVLIYRTNPRPGERQFMGVDLDTGAPALAFDHAALAKALATATGKEVRATDLPLDTPEFDAAGERLRFQAFGKGWLYQPGADSLRPDETRAAPAKLLPPGEILRGAGGGGGQAATLIVENTRGDEIEMFWVSGNHQRKSYGRVPAGKSTSLSTYVGHRWLFTDAHGDPLGGIEARTGATTARVGDAVADKPRPKRDESPDGKWRAEIRDHNVAVVPQGGGDPIMLSSDGTGEDGYSGPFHWSPDSSRVVAWRAKAVEVRKVYIVQSSPKDQLQPKLINYDYAKPGDPIRQPKPRMFDPAGRREIEIDDAMFDNPWNINAAAWSPDSAEFSFVYNQRGHQLMRLVGVRAESGAVRVIHEERSKTFIDYSQKFWLHRLPEAGQLLWASESSGYNHIDRIDVAKGEILNPVTRGEWNVREVVRVDEEKQRLLLKINGQPGSDPYYEHYAWVNFDGSGFIRLTEADGNHRIEFSPDGRWLLDTWSRVDQPPVVELRRADNGKLVAELARADDTALVKHGWQRPERFVAKGRDGKTDIHGIIIRPPGFDPARKYPVIEYIYAGPHDYFVPKSFFVRSIRTEMAGLGFVVVSIDGMGTNWRSKAFHDVCWKNLADSGFPDRIPWIKAAAANRPWMDLTRVGIFGGSAGGQSTLAGLLHHGDFYQVGVADCGCHDNRMDKIWWNEAWMGWPVDESYARNSNVTHAAMLRGKLMLVVGELDHNVDPASTMQVVGALQQAGISFDFVPIVNADHGAAESPYGKFRRAEFLVRHLGGAVIGDQ